MPDSELCRIHAQAASNGHAPTTRSATTSATVTAAAAYAGKVATPQPNCAAAELKEAATDDPFHAIAEAMSRAAEEIQQSEESPDALPSEAHSNAHDGLLGRAVYSTSYCVGYGIAFPTFLALGMVPMNNAFGRGLLDGANSAKESVGRREEARAAKKAATHPRSDTASPDRR